MSKSKSFRQNLYVSLALHAVILAVLVFSFEFSSRTPVLENSDKNSEVVNAMMVDQSKIIMPHPIPTPPPKAQEQPKSLVPPKPVSKPPVKPKLEVKKPAEVAVQQKTIAIPEKPKKIFQKDLIQKQLLADLKQVEKKQKKDKHKELEAAFAKEIKAQAAKSLQQQLLNEQNRLASMQSAKMQGVVDKYKALILQSIGQHWIVPNGIDKKLTSQLLIRIAPGGTVLDVQLVKSSGDDALDRSARAAVFKASPLPVPVATDEFEPFRQFILKVRPENVLVTDSGLS